MAKYFNFFPKTYYTLKDRTNSLDTVTNIIARYNFDDKLKENTAAFYEYEVKDGDTPEIIASKYYDNPERHWIVLLFNNIVDAQFDWPLDYGSFLNFVEKKYSAIEYADTANTGISGISWARNVNNIHSYYKLIVEQTSQNTFVNTIEVDPISYANSSFMQIGFSEQFTLQDGSVITISFDAETKTYFDYEQEVNENKRKIKLLKREFIPAVEKEFKKTIKE